MKSHFANGEIPEQFMNGSNMAAGNEGSAVENDLHEDTERYLREGGDIHWLIFYLSHILLDFSQTFWFYS